MNHDCLFENQGSVLLWKLPTNSGSTWNVFALANSAIEFCSSFITRVTGKNIASFWHGFLHIGRFPRLFRKSSKSNFSPFGFLQDFEWTWSRKNWSFCCQLLDLRQIRSMRCSLFSFALTEYGNASILFNNTVRHSLWLPATIPINK